MIFSDNSMVITEGQGDRREEEEVIERINGVGRRLDLGCEHTMQYIDNVL